MQKLREKRITNTPTVITQDRSNCGLPLNNSKGLRNSVAGSKTSFNNPDASLTARGHAGRNLRVSVVYVLNKRKEPLMPCSPRKARILLRGKRARVVKRTPFTIQLTTEGGQTKQPVTLGVDSGYNSLGLSAVSDKKELYRAKGKLKRRYGKA